MASNPPSFDGIPEENIIRVTSYHRRDLDHAVLLIEHKQILGSIRQPSRDPLASLGPLQVLPAELLHEVCFLLDIQSLFRFRQVSRGTRNVVSSIRAYQKTAEHAPHTLRAILHTKIASWFTIRDLFQVLHTRDCSCCGAFGGFIFLPTFLRCCFWCVKEGKMPAVVSLDDVSYDNRWKSPDFLNSIPNLLDSIPTVRAKHGFYERCQIGARARRIVTMDDFIRLSEPWIGKKAARKAPFKELEFLPLMATTTLPHLDLASGKIQNVVSCSGCRLRLEQAPKESTEEIDARTLSEKCYSHDEFIAHFRQCHEAQKVWSLSRTDVDIAAKKSDFVRQGGYYPPRPIMRKTY
ncbi:hypothetical protein BO78DRAFT_461361 [Aspergillus sclerotiicarbonarius CBS 121057]|uniref:F-box domain-containing protein n=1 Tax=Aspergillus sclerotiicarbonarius (strain CBS 121057 / IBT 28362) TaxID=1448318 RepID=A0A319EI19_ASPSB|nr:hypothetical protein BO78DRAFT_461361 [Aspergillus sclerotiicarbonarius CBS 121057]